MPFSSQYGVDPAQNLIDMLNQAKKTVAAQPGNGKLVPPTANLGLATTPAVVNNLGPAQGYNADVIKAIADRAAAANTTQPTAPSNPFTPYSGPSGDQMAKQEYAAQYALLDKMRGDANTGYTNAGNQMGSIYETLAKQMAGQSAGIKDQYAQSGKTIGDNYNSAISQSNAGYNSSRSAIEQMANRLGIQQGVPGAEADSMNQQNFLTGLMKANQLNDTSTNTQMGNNQVSYNNRNAQIENNMGASSQQDFKQRLLTALSGIDKQQMAVTGNQAASANKYDMAISNQNATAKAAWNTDQTNKAKEQVATDRLALDAKIAENKAGTAANDQSKMNAYQILSNDSNTAYNGNPQDAQKAQKIIADLYQGGWGGDRNWDSAGDFYNDVVSSNPAAASSQLQQLATMFYAKMNEKAGGANKPMQGGTNGARTDWTH